MSLDRDHLLDHDVLNIHDNGDVPNQIGSTAVPRLPPTSDDHHELRESPSNVSSASSSSTPSGSAAVLPPPEGIFASPLRMPSTSSRGGPTPSMREHWEINYREAAIFLEVNHISFLNFE
jgi:hypothetical protein